MDRGLRPRTLWLRATRRLLITLAVAAVIGVATGWFWQAQVLALLWLLVRNTRNLVTLRRWLERPKLVELPITTGIWADVFDGLLILQKRNRKRKRRLAAILSEFQSSTAALPDGAIVLGLAGEIVWFNQAAQALVGLRQPQDLGLRVANLVRHPNFTEYFARDDYRGEVEAPSPINKLVTLSFRIIPYGNSQRLLIVRDVSDLHRLETARRDFVANASHELRTPLTVLRGYLDVMDMETADGRSLAEWRGPISEMRAQSSRMESLIADLLKLARLESEVIHVRQDSIDVPQLLSRLRSEAEAISKGRHRFEFKIQPDLKLYGRESEIQSVFMNLIANAIQYTPAGGQVSVHWASEGAGAMFEVRDTGIGISEKDLQRVTERFYRVDVGRSRASGGTGLGLSIVKHALENHEGRLVIESQLGEGSTFRCHFPPHRIQQAVVRGELKQTVG